MQVATYLLHLRVGHGRAYSNYTNQPSKNHYQVPYSTDPAETFFGLLKRLQEKNELANALLTSIPLEYQVLVAAKAIDESSMGISTDPRATYSRRTPLYEVCFDMDPAENYSIESVSSDSLSSECGH